jgi:hypothetical protein
MNVARVNPLSIGELRVAAAPSAWRRCGFRMDHDRTIAGDVPIHLVEGDGGVVGCSVNGLAAERPDALPIESATSEPVLPHIEHEHPLRVTRIDHIVVFTPDLDRTTCALQEAGLELRRIREPDEPGPPVRQAFFRLGEVILEVVESPEAEGAARFWGITFRVADLDRCAELLGERLGEVRDAVQPGRRIATVRRTAGLGLPVALISEPARR